MLILRPGQLPRQAGQVVTWTFAIPTSAHQFGFGVPVKRSRIQCIAVAADSSYLHTLIAQTTCDQQTQKFVGKTRCRFVSAPSIAARSMGEALDDSQVKSRRGCYVMGRCPSP